MKENKYDDPIFFEKYSQMSRSKQGLQGAGEWETLKELLPDFREKRVLDKTTPRLIQFHTLKNAVNPPFLGGFLISGTVAA